MDNIKIGCFISELRKEKGLTQKELAEKIGVTGKAVSKWETGKGLPDVSLWLALSEALGVNVSELLHGERIEQQNFAAEADKTLIETVKTTKKRSKKLMVLCCSLAASFLLLFLSVFGVLAANNSFFTGRYSDYIEGRYVSIPVPPYTYFQRQSGMTGLAFKTLTHQNEANVFIDMYLSTLEPIEKDGETLYYDKTQDITIYSYSCRLSSYWIISNLQITVSGDRPN